MRWHRTTPLAPDTTKWSAGEGQRVHNATPLSRDAGEGQGVRGLRVTVDTQKRLVAVILVALVAGCSAPNLPDPAATVQKKANQEKFDKAKLRYAAFLDEATRGADLLGSQPEPDALEAEIKKLNKLLVEATDVYPEHETLDLAGKRCKGVVRFFTASLTTIQHHFKDKAQVPEPTKVKIYRACVSNEKAVRQTVEEVRSQLGLTPKAEEEK